MIISPVAVDGGDFNQIPRAMPSSPFTHHYGNVTITTSFKAIPCNHFSAPLANNHDYYLAYNVAATSKGNTASSFGFLVRRAGTSEEERELLVVVENKRD